MSHMLFSLRHIISGWITFHVNVKTVKYDKQTMYVIVTIHNKP